MLSPSTQEIVLEIWELSSNFQFPFPPTSNLRPGPVNYTPATLKSILSSLFPTAAAKFFIIFHLGCLKFSNSSQSECFRRKSIHISPLLETLQRPLFLVSVSIFQRHFHDLDLGGPRILHEFTSCTLFNNKPKHKYQHTHRCILQIRNAYIPEKQKHKYIFFWHSDVTRRQHLLCS